VKAGNDGLASHLGGGRESDVRHRGGGGGGH
jgi:hypothetical protein